MRHQHGHCSPSDKDVETIGISRHTVGKIRSSKSMVVSSLVGETPYSRQNTIAPSLEYSLPFRRHCLLSPCLDPNGRASRFRAGLR